MLMVALRTRTVYGCHFCMFACGGVHKIAVCMLAALETPRFSHTDDTTVRGQRMCGIETAKLKEGETFTYSKRYQFTAQLLNAACQGKSSWLCFDLRRWEKKSGSVFVIFIKRSSFTPPATRP